MMNLLIDNVQLWDGTNAPSQTKMSVEIHDGHIHWIGAHAHPWNDGLSRSLQQSRWSGLDFAISRSLANVRWSTETGFFGTYFGPHTARFGELTIAV